MQVVRGVHGFRFGVMSETFVREVAQVDAGDPKVVLRAHSLVSCSAGGNQAAGSPNRRLCLVREIVTGHERS